MGKPDDIEQWAWDKAFDAGEDAYVALSFDEAQAIVARAIMDAVEGERERNVLEAISALQDYGRIGFVQRFGWTGLMNKVSTAIRQRDGE